MAVDKLRKFTNRIYPYETQDDTFIARGYHLNMLRDLSDEIIDALSGAGSYTFQGGLTETNGVVQIGGTTSEVLWVKVESPGAFLMDGYDNATTPTQESRVRIQQSHATLYANTNVSAGGSDDETAGFLAQNNNVGAPWNLSAKIYFYDHSEYPNWESSIEVDVNSMTVLDNLNNKGLVYAADYSTNGTADDRWIPDYGAVKAYADSVGGSSYTFDSGLTEAGGNVDLGGTLTAHTSIDMTDAYYFQLQGSSATYVQSSRFYAQDDGIALYFFDNATYSQANEWAYIIVDSAPIQSSNPHVGFGVWSGLNRIGFDINQYQVEIIDSSNTFGLRYAADYSTNGSANSRWIPDWGAVTTQIGGQNVNALIISPTGTQDGYAITWDNGSSEYTLTAVSGGSVSFGANDQIPVTNSTTDDFDYTGDFYYTSSSRNLKIVDSATSTLLGHSFTSVSGAVRYETRSQGQNNDQLRYVYGASSSFQALDEYYRFGGTIAAQAAAPTDSNIHVQTYYVYHGAGTEALANCIVRVDGTVAAANTDARIAWGMTNGAGSVNEAIVYSTTGDLQLPNYGGGTISGTAAYGLGVDASGNVIETSPGTSNVSVLNQANNRIVTVTGTTDVLTGETNFTFDGTDATLSGAGKLNFRATSQYVNSSATNVLDFGSGATYRWSIAGSPEMTLSVTSLYCNTNEGISLGSSTSQRWLYGYFVATYADTVYVEDSNHYIDTSTTHIRFRDEANTTPVTLSDLVAKSDVSVANQADNRVVTATASTDALNAEANMTFNGSTLAVTGAITATGEITAYSSDQRLKKNVALIGDALDKIKKLNGVTYKWNELACRNAGFTPAHEEETGMIAQNLQSVIKDAVALAPFDDDGYGNSRSGEEYLTIKPEKVIPVLIEAVKALTEKVEQLERR